MTDTPRVDIGHDMTAGLRLAEGLPDIENGTPIGVLLSHACPKRGGARVEDWIPTDGRVSAVNPWSLVSRDPISIHPSVAFTCCGLHGFVTAGRWVPA